MTNYQNYLHNQAVNIATEFRRSETALLDIFQKLDVQKVYLELGYPSLFAYAMQELKLSEAVACTLIQVGRKARQIPELKAAIDQGEISISKAQRVVSVLTPANKNELLTMAKALPKRELERQVAKLHPQAAVAERARFVAEERLELKLGISEASLKQFRRVQDLLSTKEKRAVTLEETLTQMSEEFLERHDPLAKAQRAQARELRSLSDTLPCPGKVEPLERRHVFPAHKELGKHAAAARSPLPAQIKHQVTLRDQGTCTFVDKDGQRCHEKRWLHKHHQMPLAYGGADTTDNLTLLCAGHHRVVHRRH